MRLLFRSLMKLTLATLINSLLMVLMLSPAVEAEAGPDAVNHSELIVHEFEKAAELSRWRVVNDGVMGGLSRGEMVFTDEQTAVFQGLLSLDNNGGFSSVRSKPTDYGLDGYDGFEIRIRGDGRTYQFRLRSDDRFDGIAYRRLFTTRTDEWMTIRLELRDFVPVFRGRKVMDAAPLSADRIRQVGFLIADRKPGAFKLEIDWIKALKSP